MSDPISTYRNVCQNAALFVGGSGDAQCRSAAINMVQTAIDGLRHHTMSAADARAVIVQGELAHATGKVPQLAPMLSELESRVEGLEQTTARQEDHIAPARARAPRAATTHAASPQQSLAAGLPAALARVDHGMLPSEIQHSLFRDRAQTTRTLGALATMSPSALRELVETRVGRHDAGRVIEAIGANVAMQFRSRVAERAGRSLEQAASVCERRASGAGLQAVLDTLRGSHPERAAGQLIALGADAKDLGVLLLHQDDPASRADLARLVSTTMRTGAEEMRGLRAYFEPAHAVLDCHGEVYSTFPESVRQVGAQLGSRGDSTTARGAAQSALGSLVHADIAQAHQSAEIDEHFQRAAFFVAAVCTPAGIGSVLAGGLAAGARETAVVGVTYQRSEDMRLASAAGELDVRSAERARGDFETARFAAALSVAAEVGVGGALHLREVAHGDDAAHVLTDAALIAHGALEGTAGFAVERTAHTAGHALVHGDSEAH